MFRKEEPEIPLKALREIIVNAFCHAQYDANTTFEISIFKDRVSIYSPGFFPDGFTPLDFAFKHEEPIMLNPKIINVLFKTCEIMFKIRSCICFISCEVYLSVL